MLVVKNPCFLFCGDRHPGTYFLLNKKQIRKISAGRASPRAQRVLQGLTEWCPDGATFSAQGRGKSLVTYPWNDVVKNKKFRPDWIPFFYELPKCNKSYVRWRIFARLATRLFPWPCTEKEAPSGQHPVNLWMTHWARGLALPAVIFLICFLLNKKLVPGCLSPQTRKQRFFNDKHVCLKFPLSA